MISIIENKIKLISINHKKTGSPMKKRFSMLAMLILVCRMATAADFIVTNVNDAGPGSLRQAILSANSSASSATIQFAIPGNGPHVIKPATPLPVVAYTTQIDGYTQPGSLKPGGTTGVNIPGSTWPAKIMVEINGDGMAGNGLEFAPTAYNSSVKGLSIVGFGTINTQAAIYVRAPGMTIAGNLIGLRPDGTKLANAVGIYGVGCDNVTIGGTSPESRNVISGNTFEGITFMPAGANLDNFSTGHNIQYNFVGTNVYGSAPTGSPTLFGNGLHGIDMDGANNSFILDNVIGGSGEYGIGIDATYSATPPMINNVTVMRNRIGIGMDGNDIGNSIAGIMVINAHDIIIGSSVTNHNIIAYNGTGVIVHNWPLGSTTSNSYNVQITYNRIYNNDGLGIDLNGDGVTMNDYGTGAGGHDADLGPNGLQNYPEIDSAYVKNGELIIKGRLRSDKINSTYNVVFFNNPQGVVVADAYGYECYIRIGLIAVTTDANGEATFTAVYPYTTEYGKGQANFGDHIVAFARSATENTSEFSPAFQVTAYSDKVCYSTTTNQATYSIAAVPGATGYTWTVPSGGTIVSGQNTTEIVVNWQNVAVGTYTVCVTASNTCGTSYSSCLPVDVQDCTTDLGITKTANPNPVIKTGTLTYLITVTNNGTIPALNVVVTDNVPSTLTVTGTTPSQGTWSAPTWTVGTLAAGASATLQIVTTVGPSASNPTANTATVTSSTPDNNSANNNATVSVEVSNRLAISCPPPVTVSCASYVPAHATDYASFIALGGTVSGGNPLNGTLPYTVSWISDVISNQTCSNNYIITRTYSATDKNNTETCSQIITVNDQTSPTITCPPAATYICALQIPAPATNYDEFVSLGGSASDGCGGVVIVLHVSDVITNQTCTNRFTLTRTYRAIDECENASICQQIITVNDDVAPTFTVPVDKTITCDASNDPKDTGIPVIDPGNCGGTNQTYSYTDTWKEPGEGCNGTGVILRTWTVTDQCGNLSTAIQKITIVDNADPQIVCIGNQFRNANFGNNYLTTGTEFDPSSATDNCGVLSVTYTLSGATTGSGNTSIAGILFNSGLTTVNWTVTDECRRTASCSFTVTVNAPPVAIDDVNTTFIDMPVSGKVLTNDSDPEGNALTVTAQTDAVTSGNGTVTIDANGNYTYTQATGFTGTDTFTYTVCDIHGLCDVATVTIKVMPLPTSGNDAPVAVNDAYRATLNTTVTGTVLANDFDVDGDALTVISDARGKYDSNGVGIPDATLSICTENPCAGNSVYGKNSAGNYVPAGVLKQYADGTFEFVPTTGFTGQVTYTYVNWDGTSTNYATTTDVATVTIDITPSATGNSTFATDDSYIGFPNMNITGNLQGNDYDPQGNTQTINITPVSGPAHGTVTINRDGTFSYIPNAGYSGPDQFIYSICDNGNPVACSQATAYLNIVKGPDYCSWRTIGEGDWTDNTIWQGLVCGTDNWAYSSTPPTNDRPIYIYHNVTIEKNVKADSLFIMKSGNLAVCGKLTIDNQVIFEIDEYSQAGQLTNCGGCSGGEVKMNTGAKIIARKALDATWDMISLPFEVTEENVFIAGTNTPAKWGGLETRLADNANFIIAEYDGAKRASDPSAVSPTNSTYFKSVNPKILTASKGYIITGGLAPVEHNIDFVAPAGTEFNFCDKTYTGIYYEAASSCNEGWNMVGTPYYSKYNLNYATPLAPYYIWTGTSYETVNDNQDWVLNPFMAFFLQVPDANSTVNNYDALGLSLFVKPSSQVSPAMAFDELKLTVTDIFNADNTILRLKENASIGYDNREDGIKFLNSNTVIPQIYTEAAGACSPIAVNTLPVTVDKVHLKVRTGKTGTYRIRLEDSYRAPNYTSVMLVDTDNDFKTELLDTEGYSYESTTTGVSSRFYVLLTKEEANDIEFVGNDGIIIITRGKNITLKGVKGLAGVRMYDVVGKLLYQYQNITNGGSFDVNVPGVYIMDISTETQNARVKILINNNGGN